MVLSVWPLPGRYQLCGLRVVTSHPSCLDGVVVKMEENNINKKNLRQAEFFFLV